MTELAELHARHVLTPWIAQGGFRAPVLVRGEGSSLFDETGKKYLDAGSGLVAVNLGHSHPAVAKAIADQAHTLCYSSPAWFNDKRAILAEKLSKMSPWDEGARVFFTTGGAESNDDMVRIVRALTGRSKILTAYRSYHGASGQSIELTGEDRRWTGEAHGGAGVIRFFAPYPYRSPFFATTPEEECERALAQLERIVMHESPNRIGALLIEPIVGSNGVVVYPAGSLEGLRALCTKYGILLVFDEVMTGFGRTGAAFAGERHGVVPDLIVFAKGVTSAYVPLGGVMVRESLAKTFDDRPLPNGHTYSGHPLAVAAGVATLEAYEAGGIFARARDVLEPKIRAGLEALATKHEIIGEVRGMGAFFALELVKDRSTKEPFVPWADAKSAAPMKAFFGALRERGVYTFGRFNCVMFAPPLVVTEAELDFGFEAYDHALTVLAKG
jgi:taurine--2-oxoglutarate transaminase